MVKWSAQDLEWQNDGFVFVVQYSALRKLCGSDKDALFEPNLAAD